LLARKFMIKINIIAVGGIKNTNIADIIDEYKTRMRVFCDLNIIEIKPEPFGEKDHEMAKDKEWARVKLAIEGIKAEDVYLLAEDGREYDTVKFADKVIRDKSSVIFLLGGALGWSKSARLDRIIKPISLSQLTMTHEMARLVLVEQVYRALMIVNNRTYHY